MSYYALKISEFSRPLTVYSVLWAMLCINNVLFHCSIYLSCSISVPGFFGLATQHAAVPSVAFLSLMASVASVVNLVSLISPVGLVGSVWFCY